jgi:hypothetical protein
METSGVIICCLIFGALMLFLGYCWGNSKRGRMVEYTNELPNGFMKVISSDRISTVLEEVNVNRKRFLVSTKVFGGKPICPKDIVRKVMNDKERRDLGIPVLGYGPLVKDSEL